MTFAELGTAPKAPPDLLPVRYRGVRDQVLLTSPFGDWVFVTRDEMRSLAKGELTPGTPLHDKLRAKNFLRSTLDPAKEADRMSRKRRFLNYGPNLHMLIATLRCNETCVYCHASRAEMDAVQTDMTPEIAERSVDLALQSTSPAITIEFQGGEPLVNFPVVKHAIEYALQKNRAYGKELEFTMVTNLALLDDAKLDWLVERRVQICTSIDGPELLHNKQRILVGQSSHAVACRWIERVNERYVKLGLDPVLYHVEALLTTTRDALKYPREIVDQYVSLGCRAIFLRPIDPFGFAQKTAARVEYDRREYHTFYRTAVEHILDLNRKGTQVLERYAAIFLTKILADEEPNFLDIRNPAGSALGALAYNYDGRIFSSDEGRMLAEQGDDFFCLGDVRTAKYRDLMKHPTVRALVTASVREVQPDCAVCAYAPYCGIQPEHAYKTQGSMFGRMRENNVCSVHKGIQDFLFEKLLVTSTDGDDETRGILERWTTVRPRTHFVQAGTAS